MPSPLKSPTATEEGRFPTGNAEVQAENPPVKSALAPELVATVMTGARTVTVLSPKLATIKIGLPFRFPAATDTGAEPTVTEAAGVVNPPCPFPKSTDTVPLAGFPLVWIPLPSFATASEGHDTTAVLHPATPAGR